MNVKILKLCLMVLATLLFNGCTTTQIEYIDVPYEVKIPIKCEMPITHCDFNKDTYTEIIASMRLCIEDFRRNEEACK